MRTPSRVLRLLGVTGMLIAILATTISPAAAQQDQPGIPGMDSIFDTSDPSFKAGVNSIYFPWVANDDDFGLGDAAHGRGHEEHAREVQGDREREARPGPTHYNHTANRDSMDEPEGRAFQAEVFPPASVPLYSHASRLRSGLSGRSQPHVRFTSRRRHGLARIGPRGPAFLLALIV